MNPDRDRVSAAGAGAGTPGGGGIGQAAGAAASRAGETAHRMGDKAKEAASSVDAQARDQARRFADRQVHTSADIVAKVGESVRVAADHLEPDLPQLAYVGNTAAEWIEDYSEALREQSAEELMERSADYARRHPAMVFSAAAGAGFLLFRLLKGDSGRQRGGQFHGP